MMTKPDLLRHIAQTGYNIGYGAKKHFATYDIASKAPGCISFLTLCVGLYFLIIDFTAKKYFSAACIILGILGMRISVWDHRKEKYSDVGRKLTGLFNRVKALYFRVKASSEDDLSKFEEELSTLQDEYNETCLSEQMMFSDWYAHYKFFWQQQIDWIDEQLNFRLLRDKLPLSFSVSMVLLGVMCLSGMVYLIVAMILGASPQ
ncbi:MAG: SLATT domain-containing protein [Opitutales bacterium]|nr:SLATT domain-containing protein [Opitutales bacterium]